MFYNRPSCKTKRDISKPWNNTYIVIVSPFACCKYSVSLRIDVMCAFSSVMCASFEYVIHAHARIRNASACDANAFSMRHAGIRIRYKRVRYARTCAHSHTMRAHAMRAHAMRAHAMRAHAMRAHAMRAHAMRAHSHTLCARLWRPLCSHMRAFAYDASAYDASACDASACDANARIRMWCKRMRAHLHRMRCECAHFRGTYACPVLYLAETKQL